MKVFYINKKSDSVIEHEMHTEYCNYLPKGENRKYFGTFHNCQFAMIEAKKIYNNINGCFYCCNLCHKK